MKIQGLALLAAALISNVSLADDPRGADDWNLGSQCGLIDFADDLSDHAVKKNIFLNVDSRLDQQVSQLKTTDKQQIIITANWLKAESAENGRFKKTRDALVYIIDNGGQADLMELKIRRKSYMMVRGFPGDNAMGLIFKKGSLEVLAEIHDSDVLCR